MATLSSSVINAGARAGAFIPFFETYAAFDAADLTGFDFVQFGPHFYRVVTSNEHFTTTAGHKVLVQPDAMGALNVKAFGATGENTGDDTAAIQTAVNALNNTSMIVAQFPERQAGGVLFFPEGYYTVSTGIDLVADADVSQRVVLMGAGMRSVIEGSIAGPLIQIDGGGKNIAGVEKLKIHNTSTDSSAMALSFTPGVGSFLRNLIIQSSNDGVVAQTSSFSMHISQCVFEGPGAGNPGRAVVVGGHTTIDTCDITGWQKGIVTHGTGGNRVESCRLEANGSAIILGENELGGEEFDRACTVAGCSIEANKIGIHARSFNGTISNCQINGTLYADPQPQDSEYGVLWESTSGTMEEVRIFSEFSRAGLRIDGDMTRVMFRNINASAAAPANGWDISCDPQDILLINCNNPAKDHGAEIDRVAALDNAVARLYRTDSVSSSSTFIDVVFDPLVGENLGLFSVKSPSAGTGGTLAEGTYYYRAAPVTFRGEVSPVGTETSQAVGAGENSVTLQMNRTNPLVAYRIYRGTSPGVYDGHFDHDGQGDFTDSGQGFDGTKSPVTSGTDIAVRAEADTNYGVLVSPSWQTDYWVTNKATTGFRINFGTAPGSDESVDWFVVR